MPNSEITKRRIAELGLLIGQSGFSLQYNEFGAIGPSYDIVRGGDRVATLQFYPDIKKWRLIDARGVGGAAVSSIGQLALSVCMKIGVPMG